MDAIALCMGVLHLRARLSSWFAAKIQAKTSQKSRLPAMEPTPSVEAKLRDELKQSNEKLRGAEQDGETP